MIVTEAVVLDCPAAMAAVNVWGTVKSVPAVALTPAAVKVTVVAVVTRWSSAAVTVTVATLSATVSLGTDNSSSDAAGTLMLSWTWGQTR